MGGMCMCVSKPAGSGGASVPLAVTNEIERRRRAPKLLPPTPLLIPRPAPKPADSQRPPQGSVAKSADSQSPPKGPGAPSEVNIFRDAGAATFSGDVNARTNGELWLWSLLEPHVSTMVDVGIYKELTYPDNGRTVQHCFEPNPAFCRDLKKFESATVFLNNVGLGAIEGKMRYYSHGETMHFRPVLGCSKDCGCRQDVNIITLDSYCEAKGIDNIDFIKIDVEGHELEVLKGATKILLATEFVQFEYGGTFIDAKIKLADVYDFLKAHGFTHIYLICPNFLALCPNPIENFAYSNYLAARGPPTFIAPE